jgi:3-oxoadipate enol-lactonase
MEMLRANVIGLLEHLHIQQTHFAGISMGGMIGQILADKYLQRLEKLVLCDTTSRVPPETAPTREERLRTAQRERMAALAQETLERWLSEEFRRDRPGAVVLSAPRF